MKRITSIVLLIFLLFSYSPVYANHIKSDFLISNDLSWNLVQIEVENAWKITKGSPNITVAILDTGIDFSHQELNHSAWVNNDEIPNNDIDDDNNGYIDDINGWDWVNNDNNPGYTDDDPIDSHGTFIAGLIAAKDNNHEIVGVAPNIKLMALRVIDSDQLISNVPGLIDSVNYAIDNGADVITISFFLTVGPLGFRSAIQEAVKTGIPVVSITGNTYSSEGGGISKLNIPASFEEVIAVGASNYYKEKADYSNYGEGIELVAPVGDQNWENINQTLRSTGLSNSYRYGYGTSYAGPQVAAVIALMKSIRTNLTVDEIRYILHASAIDLDTEGWDERTGYGLLNASGALSLTETFTLIPSNNYKSSWFYSSTFLFISILIIMVIKRKKSFF